MVDRRARGVTGRCNNDTLGKLAASLPADSVARAVVRDIIGVLKTYLRAASLYQATIPRAIRACAVEETARSKEHDAFVDKGKTASDRLIMMITTESAACASALQDVELPHALGFAGNLRQFQGLISSILDCARTYREHVTARGNTALLNAFAANFHRTLSTHISILADILQDDGESEGDATASCSGSE
jgi:hypothetical protein